ncbi:hypothetical protein LINPERPRIM_LOCUS6011 [Linum perenne]
MLGIGVSRRFIFNLTLRRRSRRFLGIPWWTPGTVGRSIPSMSFGLETRKSPSPTLLEKATSLPIYLPTSGTPLILVFLLIVCTPTRSIELFGTTM